MSGRRELSDRSELHPPMASGSHSEGPAQKERAGMRKQPRAEIYTDCCLHGSATSHSLFAWGGGALWWSVSLTNNNVIPSAAMLKKKAGLIKTALIPLFLRDQTA